MSLSTRNIYGSITIADDVIAKVVNHAASECYGVAELVPVRFTDSFLLLLNKEPRTKGVKLTTLGNRVFIDVYVILKDGVNKDAVIESLISLITYHVELFSGMRVKGVTAHVVGTKL